MSDRCYMRVTCRRADAALFLDEGFFEDGDEGAPLADLVDEEANYAHQSLLEDLARRGIEFYGWNAAGDDYGPARFHGADGVYRETETDSDLQPCVRVGEDGVDPEEVAATVAYLRSEKALIARLAEPAP